jgi:hypothetical protein
VRHIGRVDQEHWLQRVSTAWTESLVSTCTNWRRNVDRSSQVRFHSLPKHLCGYATHKSTSPFSGSMQEESKTKATSSEQLDGAIFQTPCLSPPKKYTCASRPVSNSAIISESTASTIDKSPCIAVFRLPGRRRTRRQNAKFWQSFRVKKDKSFWRCLNYALGRQRGGACFKVQVEQVEGTVDDIKGKGKFHEAIWENIHPKRFYLAEEALMCSGPLRDAFGYNSISPTARAILS